MRFQKVSVTFWATVVTIFLAQCTSRPTTDVHFGEHVEDSFQWMENETDPRLRPWVAAQDKFAREHLSKIPFREQLKKRFQELHTPEWRSLPKERAGVLFYLTQSAHQEKPILVKNVKGTETVLIDPTSWKAGSRANLGNWFPSLDGKHVVYSVVPDGNENKAYVEVLRVSRPGEVSTDHIDFTKHAAPGWLNQPVWHPNNQGFFYNLVPQSEDIPEAQRQGLTVVKYHRLGTPQEQDTVIYPATKDPSVLLDVDMSVDGKWLFVTLRRVPVSGEVLIARADQSPLQFQSIFQEKANASMDVYQDSIINVTDWQAPNKRILIGSLKGDLKSLKWETLVPERSDVVIEWGALVGSHLLVQVQKDALSELEVYNLQGRRLKNIPLPAKGSVSQINYDPVNLSLFFEFQSLLEPATQFRMSRLTTKPVRFWKSKPPVETAKFVMEQKFFKSKDGTKVSMFLVTPKARAKGKPIPFLMYGYGAWNYSLLPQFNQNIFPWLEAGGGYAIVNIRGGGEYGKRWHEQGSRRLKQNSFNDFIAAAEFLIGERYTTSDQLGIRGGSFGGLLVAGAMTQRPDLFKVVLCEVPVTDMLRYHLSGIGRNWVAEFGTAEDQTDFQALRAYSPYHNLDSKKTYPATLLLSADNDERVKPSHARKFFSRLVTSFAKGPVLLRTEGSAGHGGASKASAQIEAQADKYSFLMEQTGLTPRSTQP